MNARTRRILGMSFATLLAVALPPSPAESATIFVDNRIGSDGYDGRAAKPAGAGSGPVRTIRAGLNLCMNGDLLVIVNTGDTYYESIQLNGERHSGRPFGNFEIEGNGAVVSGLRPVPFTAWEFLGNDLWTVNLYRKGHVLLVADGEVVPKHELADGADPKTLPPGHFTTVRGKVLYRGGFDDRPPERDFGFAGEEVGITLYKVHDVTIGNLVLQHFRIDGISAADSARRVTLRNVSVNGNGRAGITLKGVSSLAAVGGGTAGNLEHSIRIEGKAATIAVDEFEYDVEPTVLD